jgi:MoaA/NifB/PqqE/SkfB family radical SAM enzyme/SAM-dependent methyltransferase
MNTSLFLPRTIGIELVRGCNFDCRMCPVTCNAPLEQERFQFIKLELLERLVAEIDRWPSIETIWFFHFGEPLVHPHYRECLEILHRSTVARQAVVIEYTNASLLKGDKAEAILDIPILKRLVFSFDGFGDKESFERLRGPHFEQVLDNIKQFSAQARRRRPDLELTTCTILPRAGEVPELEIPDRTTILSQLHHLFDPMGVQVAAREMHNYSGNDQLAIKGRKPDRVLGGCRCVENDSLYFTVNGWAQPCCAVYQETFNVGQFPDQGFGELLNDTSMNKIRNGLRLDRRTELPFCRNCSLSIGGNYSDAQLVDFWKSRDRQGLIQSLDERRYIFGQLVPTQQTVTRLDLGCGKKKSGGFVGIDRFALPGVDVIADLDAPLPFADNSVDLVFASHSLEHIQDLIRTMQEIYRVCRHGAQVCIVAPYFAQGLNFANPHHKQAFNEHTPRFWTTSRQTGMEPMDPADYQHPQGKLWGLSTNDHSDPGIDFRCLRVQFTYFPEYRHLPPEEQRAARKKYIDVCDQIVYHLLVIKQPTTEDEVEEMAKQIEYYEPPYVKIRQLGEQVEALQQTVRQVTETQRQAEQQVAEAQRQMAQALQTREAELAQATQALRTREAELIQLLHRREVELTQVTHRYAAFRNRRVYRWLEWVASRLSRYDAWNDIAPPFQQLKDDSLMFGGSLRGFRLRPGPDLQSIPFVAYPLALKRPWLSGLLLAPVLEIPLHAGRLGIELVSPENQIVAQAAVPVSQVSEAAPVRFDFAPVAGIDRGRFWLRVFARDVPGPIRVFEWRRPLLGLGPLQRQAFCGFIFQPSPPEAQGGL